MVQLRAYSDEDGVDVASLIDAVVRRIDYMDYLDDDTPQSNERMENVRELQSVAKDYKEQGLAGFLEEVALVSDVDSYDENADALTLMTIHAAKGLEFPVVFVPPLE